jgi:cell filamentation protein
VTPDEEYAFGLYPDGSGVLRNKFGLRDPVALKQAEYLITAKRADDAPQVLLTSAGYQALHRHLFGEVFDWAGELRTVDMVKGGTRFATARFLDVTLHTIFANLARQDALRGRTGERFAEGAAHHLSELNAAHPFREGNGRSMRLHLSQLAAQAGLALDVTRMPGPAWIEASIRGFEGDERLLAQVIAGALAPERWVRPAAALAELQGAVGPARQEIQDATRTVRDRLTRSGASASIREVVEAYRVEVERLDAANILTASLAALANTDGLVPVRAAASASARDRAHAILAAADRLSDGLAPAPALGPDAALDAVRAALRPATSAGPAPWDAGLTPLGPRLAAYMERLAAEAEAARRPPAPEPGATPDEAPAPSRPAPSRGPGPGS